MIGDLFGNIGEQQEILKQQLDEIEIIHTSKDEIITINLTASRRITDISINKEKLDLSDTDQLEDILLITLNEAFEKADKISSEKTQEIVQDMLPPGFGSMFGM
jgi:DNA-binding protein YbaB